MPDQAHHLRTLVREAVAADAALAPGAPIIAISGARPQIGATATAHALATQLASLGKQTILIQANLNSPHHPTSPDQAWSGLRGTLHDILHGNRRAIETLIDVSENLRLLPAACGLAPSLDPNAYQRFAAEIAALTRQCDILLIDAGHGMTAWIDHLWQLATQVLLVTAPDSAAMVDAYAAVKLSQFHRLDARLRLVFNRCSDSEAEAAPWFARFHDTCARFLFVTPKPPATLAAFSKSAGGVSDADSVLHTAGVPCPHRYSEVGMSSANPNAPDTPFTRSARLLAADLIAEARTLRIPLPRREGLGEGFQAQAPRNAPADRVTAHPTWTSLSEARNPGSQSRCHIANEPPNSTPATTQASTRFFPDL